jgi:murein DD-endopeptidase MepM/ murein hydrolase activator NlpD
VKLKKSIVILIVLSLSSCSLFQNKNIKPISSSIAPLDMTPEVIIKPKKYTIYPGEVIKVVFPYDENVFARHLFCGKKKIPVFRYGKNRVAYVSESYFSKRKTFQCSFERRNGEVKPIATIKVDRLDYPAERLKVKKRRVTLNKKDLKRVRKEQKYLNAMYASGAPWPHFGKDFLIPLDSKITSYYGSKRIFNNKKQTQHLGTDFRAAIGTPIKVSNNGVVTAARELFYTGNTVIVSHGLGIFTVYGHLSELKVSEGEYIPQGTLIGLAGMTGRVTGPHLHWGVKVHGHYINGKSLVMAGGYED